MDNFSLRLARPDELQTLVRIDDEASEIFADTGLTFTFEPDHPFLVAELARWAAAIEGQLAYIALDARDQPVGFATLGYVDGEPYLDQLSVRPGSMRQGVGAMLVRHAIAWSGEQSLWLTTYSHILWNKPYYERHGFVVVPEQACGPELRGIIQAQREALPDPDCRVAMVHRA